ncbi:hypothetical protein IC620_00155 [Hazenella sp. IB182357]|uniref:Uncharacterized protein n=1 Tax=Polycladospora coralii TaxID=2771432 RepID=A0A926RT24_9BACL|nr:hypothetical protein [Polycladospora coralii]MBD1370772.1 hypothetical protein [Polycladospora coralii]MBS7529710.1 hypothetical protein [Polycladospora coralii]
MNHKLAQRIKRKLRKTSGHDLEGLPSVPEGLGLASASVTVVRLGNRYLIVASRDNFQEDIRFADITDQVTALLASPGIP